MSLLRVCGSPPALVASTRPRKSARLALDKFLLALIALAAVMGTVPAVEAAPRRAKSHAKAKHQSGRSTRAAARGKAKADVAEATAAAAKVAVFAFQGEDTYSVRDHVMKALTDRGLKVEASIPPVDTTEQYRDMGAVMNLAAYVHGHVKELPADHAVATIVIRSGVTGRKLTTATFRIPARPARGRGRETLATVGPGLQARLRGRHQTPPAPQPTHAHRSGNAALIFARECWPPSARRILLLRAAGSSQSRGKSEWGLSRR